jgi:hypothetical protein
VSRHFGRVGRPSSFRHRRRHRVAFRVVNLVIFEVFIVLLFLLFLVLLFILLLILILLRAVLVLKLRLRRRGRRWMYGRRCARRLRHSWLRSRSDRRGKRFVRIDDGALVVYLDRARERAWAWRRRERAVRGDVALLEVRVLLELIIVGIVQYLELLLDRVAA